MKKTIAFLLSTALAASLAAGCAQDRSPESTPSAALDERVPAAIDVDLTALSSTMVFAEVYNMMAEPERYVGKTIKVRGLYYASYYEPADQYYHFVVVSDATACCAQGLEFMWTGDHRYPEDYPADETDIEIAGAWARYEEDGETWYRIVTEAIDAAGALE